MFYIKLKPMSSKIKTSGGIVIKNDKILFIYKNGKWDLPKGKLEKGINSKDTAIIEISEETGLPKKELVILKKLIPTYYHKNINGTTIVKKTYWYLVEFTGNVNTPLVPDTHEGITECKWFSLDELGPLIKGSHNRIKYLIAFFLEMPYYKKYRKKLVST